MPDTIANDILDGAEEIRAFLGEKNVRRVFYMLENGQIPGFKIGQRWRARKSTLLAHFETLEKGNAAKP